MTPMNFDPFPAKALLAKHQSLTYPYECTFGDANLEIDRGVFCPTLTNASPFLLKSVDFKPGENVLDAFAGSRAFGIHAALSGASVVAFDSSAAAIACIEKNAGRNGVQAFVDARLGTLNQTITYGETFDLIIANPPLLPGLPAEELEMALFDEDLKAAKEFVAALPGLLRPRGRCYLLSSDVIERPSCEYDIDGDCHRLGLTATVVAQLPLGYETYRVHKITHQPSA